MRRAFVLVAALLGLLVLGGCGSDDGSGDSTGDSTTDATSSDTATQATDGPATLAASCPAIQEAIPARELPRHEDWTDVSTALDGISEAGDDDTKAALEKMRGTLSSFIAYPEMSNGEYKALNRAFGQEVDEISSLCESAGSPITL